MICHVMPGIACQCASVRRGVAWRGVAWRGVVWCGVVWCGVVWYCIDRYGTNPEKNPPPVKDGKDKDDEGDGKGISDSGDRGTRGS